MYINVSESLPEKYKRVLVVKDCGENTLPSFSIGYVNQASEWEMADAHCSFAQLGYRVTHWEELPNYPGE